MFVNEKPFRRIEVRLTPRPDLDIAAMEAAEDEEEEEGETE